MLLIDPYHPQVQAVIFKSSYHVNHDIFKASDVIISQVIQSTMGKKKDMRYKINLWTQFPNKITK